MSETDDRYRPRRLQGGVVAQSGLDLQPRGSRRSRLNPREAPYRAIVINSRVVGEDGNLRNLCVECDVIPIRTQVAVPKVPVLQRQHGVNNVHDLWVPRASTRVIDSDTPLNVSATQSLRGDFIGPGSNFGALDGDMVLLDFIEGNPSFPIIIGALTHERTNRVLRAGDGWREGEHATRGSPRRNESYTHHYGCEVRINEQGDLLIDTVGAYSDITTEDTSSSSGQIRMRVKTSQRLTIAMGDDEDVLQVYKDGSQLRVDIGKNADEPLVLGNALRTYINNEVQTKVNQHIGIFNGHIHTGGTISGNTGVPTATDPTNVAAMGTNVLSDLAKTKKT